MSYSNPILTYNDADFRTQFPYFASTVTYTPTALQQYFTNGTSYISDYNSGFMQGADRQQALYLMTAHLAALNDLLIANNGAAPGMVKDAAIDKVHVGLQPPPVKSQWAWWLNLTPWGMQLYALLQAQSVGGWSVAGLPERFAFRRVAGGFGGPRMFRGGRF